MSTLQNKFALVTGAGYGVGRAIAIGLAREGCDIILAARSQDKLEETQRRIDQTGRQSIICKTDITQIDEIRQLAQTVKSQFGQLDILVHCAFGHIGEDEGKSLLDVTSEELYEFGLTSIIGTWWLVKELAPILQESHGRVVFLVSDWGLPQHNIFLSTTSSATTRVGSEAFVSAKYAVTGFANAIERMLNIPTIGIFPGIIASVKPSTLVQVEPEYFDIDDPVKAIEAEVNYKGGWAIPLIDVVDIIIASLKCHCVVKTIVLKPPTSEYEGLHS